MKQIFITLLLLMSIGCSANAQSNKLQYVLPDNIEVKVNNFVVKYKEEYPQHKLYCLLQLDTVGIYHLSVVPYLPSQKLDIHSWIKSTNRFVLINETTYPLLFDYDIALLPFDGIEDYGKMGKRGDLNSFKIFGLGGSEYAIYFKLNGVIMKERDPLAPRKAPTGW